MFSEAELAFNAALTAEIERLGFAVFLPQRDGVDATKEPWARPLSRGERATHLMERSDLGAWGEGVRSLGGNIPLTRSLRSRPLPVGEVEGANPLATPGVLAHALPLFRRADVLRVLAGPQHRAAAAPAAA
jgi:hypothetical protein